MAKAATAQMSNDRLKNANATSGNNSIKSVNKMKTKKFKSLIISVDQQYDLQVKDIWRDLWEKLEFMYPLVKHQGTYYIGRGKNGFISQHKAPLQLLLLNYPFCKVQMTSDGEYRNGLVEVNYRNNQKITVEKDIANISAQSIEGVISMIRTIRYANHLGTDYKVIKQDDDSAIIRFNKKK